MEQGVDREMRSLCAMTCCFVDLRAEKRDFDVRKSKLNVVIVVVLITAENFFSLVVIAQIVFIVGICWS